MTADDFKRVKAIAGEAWTRPAAQRDAYLMAACAGDNALHAEVSSLVAAMSDAEHRFEGQPPLPVLGHQDGYLLHQRLGAYEILERIGAGGMGEVFKARDTRLDRIVAVKVLSSRHCWDPRARDRMEREAQTVAALNHPHICTLHDVGHEDGLDYLVMEHLDGETLAARLSRGPLPVADALEYARQIAAALIEAHRAGIVHHDVKPGNIMLTRGDRTTGATSHVKLLDFGLAMAGGKDATGPDSGDRTAPLNLTMPGLVLGTAHYVAPEQLEGQAADARADIFAFGAVLFEMLTAQPAFVGATREEVCAAILDGPRRRASDINRHTPSRVDQLIARCLARNPAGRYSSMDDVAFALQRASRGHLERPAARHAAAAALSVTLVGFAWMAMTPRNISGIEEAPAVIRLPATAGVLGAATISPSGTDIAFSWAGDGIDHPELVRLSIGSSSRMRLTHDSGVEEWPTWSPDGKSIAFVRCSDDSRKCGIFVIPANGGTQRNLRDLPNDRYHDLDWSPDGRWIAYAERRAASTPYELFVLSPETGETRRLTSPAAGLGELRFAFSPDARTLAVIRVGDGVGVHFVSLVDARETTLLRGQQEWFGGVAWSADGRQLILSANQKGVRRLWRLPITGGALRQIALAGENAYHPAVAASGRRMAFVHDFRDWDLSQVAINPGTARGAAIVPSSPRADLDPAFSPDGQHVAFVSERGGTREVWMSRRDGSETRQLTTLQGPPAGRPRWSPDGELIAFHANGIRVVRTSGASTWQLAPDGEFPTWSADGNVVYFSRNHTGQSSIWKVPVNGGPATQAIPTESLVAFETPDGRDLYFTKGVGGIWRRPVSGGTETLVIREFKGSLSGYWEVVRQGIYYVAGAAHTDQATENTLKFFDFARRRVLDAATVPGVLDDWVGGLTISPDAQTVLYSRRSYEAREVVLVDDFR